MLGFRVLGSGFRVSEMGVYTPKVDNQMEKTMENDTGTGVI